MTRREILSLDVSLRSDGETLREYACGEEDARSSAVTEKYVVAPTGATFSVHIHFGPGFPYSADAICADVKLDGRFAVSKIYSSKAKHETQTYGIDGVTSTKSGRGVLERFRFAQLKTDDRSVKPNNSLIKDLKKLGTIKVKLYRVKKVGLSAQQEHANTFQSVAKDSISEKCLKGRAISNQAALSEPEASVPTTYWQVEYPYGKKPFAEFHFKYRSRGDLQIEGIIERSPSPVPLEDRDPDDLTADELREQVRLLRAREEQRTKVKQEKRDHATMLDGEEEGDDDVTILDETRGRKRYRTFRDSGVDVVDLTED